MENKSQLPTNSSPFLWVEKYRPSTLDDFIGDSDIKNKIREIITMGDVPNLLFTGSPGVGKTSLAKLIAKHTDCDYIYINASDENSIDTVRGTIKSFASSIGFKTFKLVILDEFDYFTPNAMAALRNLMESFSMSTRFILTCNYLDRVIDPIKSRVQIITLEHLSRKKILQHVLDILDTEQVEYHDNISNIKQAIVTYYPDVRRIINEIQAAVIHKPDSTGSLVHKILEPILPSATYIRTNIIKTLTDTRSTSTEKYNMFRELLINMTEYSSIYDVLYNKIGDYAKTDDQLVSVIFHLAEGAKWDSLCANKEVNMMAVLFNIVNTISQKGK